MRVMTFSKFHEHSSPIFKHLNIVKLPDLVFLNIAVFMYKFHNRRLPSVLILSSLKSIKDITIIQEVLRICSILKLKNKSWNIQHKI